MDFELEITKREKGKTRTEKLKADKNDIYNILGGQIKQVDVPSDLSMIIRDKNKKTTNISLDIAKGSPFTEDGVVKASPWAFIKDDTFYREYEKDIDFSNQEEKYLTKIDPELNSYKFYRLIPITNAQGKREVTAEWGRIGEEDSYRFGRKLRNLNNHYTTTVYSLKLNEKLSKGYVDNTDIYLKDDMMDKVFGETEHSTQPFNRPISQTETELFNLLYSMAKRYISEKLLWNKVSGNQIAMSEIYCQELSDIANVKDVSRFNEKLMQLYSIVPRKIDKVDAVMAKTSDDFAEIIANEKRLIDAMRGVYFKTGNPIELGRNDKRAFSNSMEVYEATAEQRQFVKNKLSDNLKGKMDKVYRVIPTQQKARFDSYLQKNSIDKVKMLWHGSPNDNWLSITENGLSLSQKVANGRMFGDGIYFAPSSEKSFNYTSFQGSYWAHGNDEIGIMGLYATAYGNPYNPTTSRSYNQSFLDSRKCNCVHARKSNGFLRNDEIIFYDEDAVCLSYIVTFKQ